MVIHVYVYVCVCTFVCTPSLNREDKFTSEYRPSPGVRITLIIILRKNNIPYCALYTHGWADRYFIHRFRPKALTSVYIHYNDVIMSAMVSQITNLTLFTQPLIQAQMKENIKVLRHWPLAAQKASNAENASIWWRHHDNKLNYKDSEKLFSMHCKNANHINITMDWMRDLSTQILPDFLMHFSCCFLINQYIQTWRTGFCNVWGWPLSIIL